MIRKASYLTVFTISILLILIVFIALTPVLFTGMFVGAVVIMAKLGYSLAHDVLTWFLRFKRGR